MFELAHYGVGSTSKQTNKEIQMKTSTSLHYATIVEKNVFFSEWTQTYTA